MEKKLLYFCSRCHLKFQPMGEVLAWGKHYPSYQVKWKERGEWHVKIIPAENEIKEALCENCMVEVSKKKFDEQKFPQETHPIQ